jgi:NADH-quinone oxidoreductase subunit N
MFYLGLELSTFLSLRFAILILDKTPFFGSSFQDDHVVRISSGLLLFGISLLYGATGTLNFIGLKAQPHRNPLQVFSFFFCLAGFGFKISAVPFSFMDSRRVRRFAGLP